MTSHLRLPGDQGTLSWDSRLSTDGEMIPQAKLGSGGQPTDHGVPTLTHRAARQGLEMPPGELIKMQVLTGWVWWGPDAVFPLRAWGPRAAGPGTPL